MWVYIEIIHQMECNMYESTCKHVRENDNPIRRRSVWKLAVGYVWRDEIVFDITDVTCF